MAKLITNHDPFHLHKTLGLLVLLNFVYRLVLMVRYGNCFPYSTSTTSINFHHYFDIASVLWHAGLSWSSLLLPLPEKRNFNSPMIWREFRWHSIIFATRSILATLMSLLNLWPTHFVTNYAVKFALVMGTCKAADMATQHHGSNTQRTTNAMAYPSWLSLELEQRIKLNYSMAQMGATISCFAEDATYSFLPLYAIQGAAFLMTLRRKHLWPIQSTRSVHFGYQLQLCAAYLPSITCFLAGLSLFLQYVLQKSQDPHSSSFQQLQEEQEPQLEVLKERLAKIFLLGAIHLIAGHLRIDRRMSKATTWGIAILIWNWFVLYSPSSFKVLLWFHTHPAGIAYVVFSHVNEYQRVFRHYSPIWLGHAKHSWIHPIGEDSQKQQQQQPVKPVPQERPTKPLVQDLVDYDMWVYFTRPQRFVMVLCALVWSYTREGKIVVSN